MTKKTLSKKMNKKGQFFSLLAVIIIILLALFFFYKSDAASREDDLYIKRVTISSMDAFVSEFEQKSIPVILESSAKPAIAARISKPATFSKFSKNELTEIMKDGEWGGVTYLDDIYTTDNAYKETLGTLTFTIKNGGVFDYSLDSVKQIDFKTLELDFIVNYEFELFENKWSKSNKHVLVQVPIYSLKHPAYDRRIITKDWSFDNSGNCFIEQIFLNAKPCAGLNIAPPPIIP